MLANSVYLMKYNKKSSFKMYTGLYSTSQAPQISDTSYRYI